VGETRGGASKKKLRLIGETVCAAEKQSSSPLQKFVMISDSIVQVPLGTLDRKGLSVTLFLFFLLLFSISLYDLLLNLLWFS
jgi:hypothetical protein